MAKILKEIGQCAVISGGVEYVFTPSFINIAQIGEPDEIIRKFGYLLNHTLIAEITGAYNYYTTAVRLTYMARLCLTTAIEVLESCCDRPLPKSLVGCWDERSHYVLSDKVKGIPPNDILVIAGALMTSGLIGHAQSRANDGDGASEGFNAHKFISFAVSHFGISKADAEDMTLIEFQGVFESKYPEVKEKEAERQSAHEAADYFDRIDELRKRNAELSDG